MLLTSTSEKRTSIAENTFISHAQVDTWIAPSFTIHPRTKDNYAAYNKPEAVIDWLQVNLPCMPYPSSMMLPKFDVSMALWSFTEF